MILTFASIVGFVKLVNQNNGITTNIGLDIPFDVFTYKPGVYGITLEISGGKIAPFSTKLVVK